ncbi:hypothetical protein ABZT34_34505 [Streptomyces sp. NPDC005329]|uniref:hypothetical protein n=1 Tax=Streptomyces sp. NPDC005329 TaxID=3157034 RepID=UPI0033A955D3
MSIRPLLAGAVLAALWLVFGLPVTVPSTVVTAVVVQPVTVAFAAGILARPYLVGRRWSR